MNKVMRKIKRWSKKSKLLAVEDDNIEKWLESIGILERVKKGRTQCFVCKEPMDIESIQLISRVNEEIVLVCGKPQCLYHFTQYYGKA